MKIPPLWLEGFVLLGIQPPFDKRAGLADGGHRRRFEYLFQPGLMVAVQPANLGGMGTAHDAALHQAILAAVENHQSRSHIAPEMAPIAETVV
jgi:hypothetical protein